MRLPCLAIALLAAALLTAPVAAHGPPAKRDQDARLLADHNDDCGGDDAGGLSACHGTHDLVGLDLTEAHDEALGDVVRLRLVLNGGEGQLRDVITFDAGGDAKTFELRTSDNRAFTGSGFAGAPTVAPARNADGSPDGTRVVVEGTIRLADLGGTGTSLSGFRVQASRDDARGDYMPGGYYDALGVDVADPDQGDGVTNYATPSYTLQGPGKYVALQVDAPLVAQAGAAANVDVEVTNLLRRTPQLATLTVTGGPATWAAGGTTAELDLGMAGHATATLRLQAAGPGAGTLTVEATTDLGGRTVLEVPYEVLAQDPASPTGDARDGKGTPAPGALAAGLLLLALATWRRRA